MPKNMLKDFLNRISVIVGIIMVIFVLGKSYGGEIIRNTAKVEEINCGIDAITTLLKIMDIRYNYETILMLMEYNKKENLSFFDIKQILRKLKIDCSVVECKIEDIKNIPMPAIIYLKSNRFVVLKKIENENFILKNRNEESRKNIEEIRNIYSNKLLYINNNDILNQHKELADNKLKDIKGGCPKIWIIFPKDGEPFVIRNLDGVAWGSVTCGGEAKAKNGEGKDISDKIRWYLTVNSKIQPEIASDLNIKPSVGTGRVTWFTLSPSDFKKYGWYKCSLKAEVNDEDGHDEKTIYIYVYWMGTCTYSSDPNDNCDEGSEWMASQFNGKEIPWSSSSFTGVDQGCAKKNSGYVSINVEGKKAWNATDYIVPGGILHTIEGDRHFSMPDPARDIRFHAKSHNGKPHLTYEEDWKKNSMSPDSETPIHPHRVINPTGGAPQWE